MQRLVERSLPAMGSLFTVRLVGDDEEHLAAVAEAALDEIGRVEQLLSWHDPRSECARIVREGATGADVLVDREMFDLLTRCEAAHKETGGAFGVAYRLDIGQCKNASAGGPPLTLDPARRTVRLAGPEVRLDFGAVGKGYALDVAAAEIRRYGVGDGLLDGGASSVLALGKNVDGGPWIVGVRDPSSSEPSIEADPAMRMLLCDEGLSSSATFDSNDHTGASDVVDRRTGRPLAEQAAVTVVARWAAAAEMLSTALLAMGKGEAREYIGRSGSPLVADASRILWIAAEPRDASGAPALVERLLDRSPA